MVGKEFGEQLEEKRCWHWVLTNFAIGVWGNARPKLGKRSR